MEKLTSIKEEGLSQIEACEDLAQLQQLRVLYLGKKGPIQEVMKSMKDLPKEERPAFGQLVNEVKTLFANAIEERRAVLEVAEMEKRIAEEKIDITLSGQKPNLGNAHPLMIVQQEMEDLFRYRIENPYLFTGKTETVRLRVNSEQFTQIVDWFGDNFSVIGHDVNEDKYYDIEVRVNTGGFLYWVLQYSGCVQVLDRDENSFKNRVVENLKNILSKYNENKN